MFRRAFSIARQFTLPIILSRKTIGGACESTIGSAVVINDDGWIVTAGHILTQLDQLQQDEARTRSIEAQRAALAADTTIDRHERKRREKALPRLNDDATDRFSILFGGQRGTVRLGPEFTIIPAADLGFAQLTPFDPASIRTYPRFKPPSVPCEPGVSLCKLGFPFHEITPTWNSDHFELPDGALPVPFFPIDGIFTRNVMITLPSNAPQPPFPIKFLETSTPGLRGQSGGPIFDVDGTVWAIQSQTVHLHLGFSPPVPGGKRGEREHQFLNVGWGVHPETLVGALNHFEIRHVLSSEPQDGG